MIAFLLDKKPKKRGFLVYMKGMWYTLTESIESGIVCNI